MNEVHTVVLEGGSVSYERGTPVWEKAAPSACVVGVSEGRGHARGSSLGVMAEAGPSVGSKTIGSLSSRPERNEEASNKAFE